MKHPCHLSESAIRDALAAAGGIITVAARELDVLRGALERYVLQHPDLLKLVDAERKKSTAQAEDVLSDEVDAGEPWAVKFVLKTLGKNRGYGKFAPRAVEPLPPDPEDMGDINRLKPEDRRRFEHLEAIFDGFPDGIRPPDPEFVQRLDKVYDDVQIAFASNHYNVRRAATQLGVTAEQLDE